MRGLLFIFSVWTIFLQGQVDTLVYDIDCLTIPNQVFTDGYYYFIRAGVVVREYRLISGKTTGPIKTYYDNGLPKLFFEVRQNNGVSYLHGSYSSYDECGKMEIDGCYAYADTIPCIGCYDANWGKINTKASSHSARIGTWREFFNNGRLKSEGVYNGIHETFHTHFSLPEKQYGVFTPGDYSEDYLKDGWWKYYNVKGQVIKEEFYFNGMQANVITYER